VEGREDADEVRSFGTMTKDLPALADWLKEAGCTHVAMESTGVYWKPIHTILGSDFEVILVNAHHIKYVPGRKTDVKDCQWIAQLLQHGLLKGSFIPPKPIQELRDLTRQRRKLIQERSSVVNRVQKVLEDANIKLGSVASDVMGKSGFGMIEAIVRGEDDPERLAELALGRLKGKKDELRAALQGRVTEHHRFLLEQHVKQIHFLDEMTEQFSARIAEKMQPFFDYLPLMDTIPGVALRVTEDIIAEIGADMGQFPTANQLCSWAGICPGNNESAGKKKSGRTRKGSRWLRSAL
jgi:transposase